MTTHSDFRSHLREEGDVPNRAKDATVEALIFGLLRETRDDVKKLVARFDDLSETRREEAKESGSFGTRLNNLEDSSRFNRGLAGTALIGVVVGYIIKIMGK